MEKTESKLRILIADDSEMNRIILRDMLENEYDILEAEDGLQALQMLDKYQDKIDLVLLDCVMPKRNGFEVLNELDRRQWKENVPVIMISAENDRAFVISAYNLGAVDYITRPFDSVIVQHRVDSVMRMHKQERWLAKVAAAHIAEKHENNNMLIHVLGSIVEFRNGESGSHIIHVRLLTEMFLRELKNVTDKYPLTPEDISLIGTAAAIHDIGKISIPSEILNKPGKLTDEEFAIMKSHSAVGYDMLCSVDAYQDEPLLKYAKEIARWHHERWTGRGYPDGLKGDEIPISAQAVSVADVYDALTSERCYKKAFSHEKAVEMILNGECGDFNPILMECLKNLSPVLKERLKVDSPEEIYREDIQRIVQNALRPPRS